jgi:hypothetical protein
LVLLTYDSGSCMILLSGKYLVLPMTVVLLCR